MDLFDQPPPTGEELKQQGIKQAIDHAEQVVEKWGDKALRLFIAYIKTTGCTTLKTEDARAYAEEKGLEVPPTKRAWGAIALKAARAGYIKKLGYVECENPLAHKGLITLWQVLERN